MCEHPHSHFPCKTDRTFVNRLCKSKSLVVTAMLTERYHVNEEGNEKEQCRKIRLVIGYSPIKKNFPSFPLDIKHKNTSSKTKISRWRLQLNYLSAHSVHKSTLTSFEQSVQCHLVPDNGFIPQPSHCNVKWRCV